MKRNSKAFTLVELVVTMAVTMLMMVMVISFSIMCNGWSVLGTERYNLQSTEQMARAALQNFVSLYDSNDYYITNENNRLQARKVQDQSVAGEFYFEDGSLQYHNEKGELVQMPMDNIFAAFLIVESNGYDNNRLLRLRMSYELHKTSDKIEYAGTYTILVATRALGAQP